MPGEFRIAFSAESQRLIEGAWARAPELVERDLRAFMHAATLELEGEAKEATPTDRGTLRGSIFSQVKTFDEGLGVEGIVGTALGYALPVETGARPHWVPLEPLIDWVRHKGLAAVPPYPRGTPRKKRKTISERRELAVRRVAQAIRFAIARRGTSQWQRERHGKPGAEMFLGAFEAQRAQIQADFEALARRLAAQLGAA